MKGVVLGVCPDATLVDISHDMPRARRARRRARCWRRATPTFRPARSSWPWSIPASARRAAALPPTSATTGSSGPTTACSRRCSRERPPTRVVELTERKYARPTVSRTFEGRDRFAPAAAWLAKGVALTSLGRALERLRAARVDGARGIGRRARRRRGPRRPLRQPRHQHRPPPRRAPGARRRDRRAYRRAPGAAPRRDLQRRAGRASCARSSAAPTTWKSRSTAATRPTQLQAGRGQSGRGAAAEPVIRCAVGL